MELIINNYFIPFNIPAKVDLPGALFILFLAVVLIALLNLFLSKQKQKKDIVSLKSELSDRNTQIKNLQLDLVSLQQSLKKNQVLFVEYKQFKEKVLSLIGIEVPLDYTSFDILNSNLNYKLQLNFWNLYYAYKLESSDYSPAILNVNIHLLVERVCKFVQFNFKEVVIDYSSDLKTGEILGDAGLVVLILTNLLENAVEHLPNKERPQIKILEAGKSRIEIKIADHGRGIPKKHQLAVFNKFFTLRRKTTSDNFGLGLFVSKLAVEQMGGTINLESVEDIGTTITCSFKRA